MCERIITHAKATPHIADFLEMMPKNYQGDENLSDQDWRKKHHGVFSDDERAELFSVVKKIAIGSISGKDARQYQTMVERTIRERTA